MLSKTITSSIRPVPAARDEMDAAAFDAMMAQGLFQAQAGKGFSLNEAFDLLHKDIRYGTDL